MTPLELAITDLQSITTEYVRAMAAETEARIAEMDRRYALAEAEAEAMLRADGRNAEQRDAQVQLDSCVRTAQDLARRAEAASGRAHLVALQRSTRWRTQRDIVRAYTALAQREAPDA